MVQTILNGVYLVDMFYIGKVTLIGVVALWGDCTFIPADWWS